VTEPFESTRVDVHGSDGEAEVLDALPVLAPEPTLVRATPFPSALARSSGAGIPAMQAAAVAAGGFVAGAAVVGLVHRRHGRSPALAKAPRGARVLGRRGARKAPAPGAELLQVVSSRSMLVDVHLLGPAHPAGES
jgi:hypothetical protein